MTIMTVGEVKTHFSEALNRVAAGEKIAISFGKKKEIRAFLVPKEPEMKKRKLGVLEGTKGFSMRDDFKVTSEDEFPI